MASSRDIQEQFSTFIDEKYIPLDLKAKIGIAIALILIPAVLCYFLLFKTNIETIANLDKKIAQGKKELRITKKEAANLGKFEKKLEKTKQMFQKTAIILPKEKEIPELLRTISDRGKNAGLDFLSFKPGNERPKDFYIEIPVNISTNGPYHNMGYFLDQVSKLERLVTVNNIQMSSPRREGAEMLLKSSCTLLTYQFTNKKLKTDTKKK